MLSIFTSITIRERKGQEEFLEVTDMFITLIVMTESQVQSYVKIHQRVHSPLSICSFFAYQLHLSKTIKIDLSAEIGQDFFLLFFITVCQICSKVGFLFHQPKQRSEDSSIHLPHTALSFSGFYCSYSCSRDLE